nr:MAG TPA: hypothetical protein [Caudoviricetes sp.]
MVQKSMTLFLFRQLERLPIDNLWLSKVIY